MKLEEASDETPALSLGSIVGGSTIANKPWQNAIKDLTIRIGMASRGTVAPLNVNVVFQVPGNMLRPDFIGVRTGRFSKTRALLMIQVAVPEEVPPDPVAYIKDAVHAAIDEAARWAVKRNISIDRHKLRKILERA